MANAFEPVFVTMNGEQIEVKRVGLGVYLQVLPRLEKLPATLPILLLDHSGDLSTAFVAALTHASEEVLFLLETATGKDREFLLGTMPAELIEYCEKFVEVNRQDFLAKKVMAVFGKVRQAILALQAPNA